jgi:hypothetical protein
MRKVMLIRNESGDEGTFGTILTDSGFTCRTGELPWRNNQQGLSCIPEGIYFCSWRLSKRHGLCYHIDSVPNREGIEIHSANFVGDRNMGLKYQVLGCIAIGLGIGKLDGQKAVLRSRQGLAAFEDEMKCETFELTIKSSLP